MSVFLSRRLINRRLILQCRGMALSTMKGNDKAEAVSVPQNTANVQASRKTALYDFHLSKFGRM